MTQTAQLGKRLRAAREAANLSQQELAAELGVSLRSVQDYEAGQSWPRPKRRRKILAFIERHLGVVAGAGG